ncbi:hypothetical protein [Caballeronia sp. INDeC2]|uniref:hypothetical protein n=1 Tax=Caballeronia sp. INDeC2 TaxID=2921747 RepID=UPI0020293C21|nr:hypothetical protein [Caballeronia sp. INDeC2]
MKDARLHDRRRIFHHLEPMFDYWKDTHDLVTPNHALITHIIWPQFRAVQILTIRNYYASPTSDA